MTTAQPGVGVGTIEQTRPDPDPGLDDGDDGERWSHYVKKNKIMGAMVEGTPVTALCGKVWVPSRDPEKFPVCPRCKQMMDMLHSFDGADASP